MRNKIDSLLQYILKFISSRIFLYLTLAWFTIQSVLHIAITKVGLPPDENWHIGLIRLYTRDGADPFIQNQTGFFFLGDVTRNVGFLYHYLLSFPLRVFDLINQPDYELYFLRSFSLVFGVLTIYLVYRLLNHLKVEKYVVNMTIFLLTNTTMFVVMSSSVNYDAALIALTALSIYLLVLLIQKFSLKRLLWLTIVVLVALLTKVTFAPLAVILALTYIVVSWKSRKKILTTVKDDFVKYKAISLVMLGVIAVLTILLSTTYVRNYVSYGDISPNCSKIHSLNDCRQSAIFVRNEGFAKLNPDKSSLLRFDNFASDWVLSMQERIFGYFTFNSYVPFAKISSAINLFYLLGIVATIRYINRKNKYNLILLFIASSYYIVLLLANWTNYSNTGIYGYALQGRYALPVWFIFNYLAIFYITAVLRNRKKLLVTFLLATLLIFFLSSLPTFIIKTDSSWRADWTTKIIAK